ncbi:galactose mutarotase [Siculibacillus lacustris]|uniref:Aldose 1-epimerase n=1 Tax=Siculibacillus lacustris TaxID=1549641 RepID=A0A4Q9VYX5_9HYPH|nr:aldose epimerase family protein [Siculibacillus lacustris]TBW41404.1 galactose mutarotase [Siculibacillus lacustris]
MKTLLCTLGCLSLSGLAYAADPQPAAPAYTEIKAADYQATVDGKPVSLWTMTNAHGVVVRITNWGARIEQILVPDRAGRLGDIAQGYPSLETQQNGQGSLGAFVGRYANRIAKGRFTLDGQAYQLAINDLASGANPRENTLHGGKKGSRFVVFDARQLSPASVEMSYVFKDGEESFPGTLPVRVVYTLKDDDSLSIEWAAVANDKKTVANFTQHTFFNLSGDLGSSIYDHQVTLNAEKTLEIDATLVPSGKILPVAGTPLDFRTPKPIGRDIEADFPALKAAGGFDHHFVIAKKTEGLELAARVSEPVSGRILEVWTTEPGVQFYSGNFLEGKVPRDVGKGGVVYKFRSGFCLEPSHFPDSVNHPDFPSTVLNPGQWYTGQIVYRFLTDKK